MFKTLRRMPFFKVLALAEAALLAKRHFGRLDSAERRRLRHLVRHGHHLEPQQRDELMRLVAKMEPRAFAYEAANKLSPVPLPRRLAGRKT